MYEAGDDPYCYPGTTVLKNLLDLRTQEELDEFESTITAQRADEPLPLYALDVEAYRAIHRHLFQDVYQWAGEYRTVRVSKGSSAFCYPDHIDREMRSLFDQLADENFLRDLEVESFSAKAAHFMAELNAIHPFREGNGRTQNIFLALLADRAGHPLDFARLDPPEMLNAMIASFKGHERPLRELILHLRRGGQ